ncbi:MAG: 3-phosphoshikimate 1-carboxyvinyltransferase [Nitrospirae bacterium]|nr:3-phosphoshikimate 1-carboxyvinyltransferase [Nitrospirota bacterium]
MPLKRNSKRHRQGERVLDVIKVTPKGSLRGEIVPPPDKSISHRAVILGSLSEGESTIKNFLRAEDPIRTIKAFQQMGIEITEVKSQKSKVKSQNTDLIINGKGLTGLRTPQDIIDCGNSGTTMRLLCGVLAGQPFRAALTGDASLRIRPMQRVITPLTEMGARITSEAKSYPPLTIHGGSLRPIYYKSPVASAQVKSAILLAGLYCDGVTKIREPDKSRDHTERMLRAQGAEVEIKDLEVSIKGTLNQERFRGRAHLKPLDITIPGDFSSAAFFIVAGIIVPGSEISIKNVGINPTRTGLLDILKTMGAEIKIENEHEQSGEPAADLYVKYSQLKGIDIEGDLALRAIDEFPIICVAASVASGITKITGAGELRVKESDRIASMAKELRKMGVTVEELKDGIIIEGKDRLNSAIIQSHGDHRVAMSMAVAGLFAQGETIIEDTECVNTSFPGFIEMLKKLQRG